MAPCMLSQGAMSAKQEAFDDAFSSSTDIYEEKHLRLENVKNICCVGAGYVGGILSAIIASKNPSRRVTAVDVNEKLIASWNSAQLPFSEAGLDDLIEQARPRSSSESNSTNSHGTEAENTNLYFTTDLARSIGEAQVIFICVDTPVGLDPETGCQRPNLRNFDKAIETIAYNVRSDFILVEKSTVPFGNAKRVESHIASIIRSRYLDINFEVLSIPEFFAEGTAVQDLLDPARVIIGATRSPSGDKAAALLADVYNAWVPRERIITGVSAMSSELAKLASNVMLAQRISCINALSAACAHDQSDADVRDVSRAIGMDPRIGPHMLQASVGYGGSCLSKDVCILAHFYDNAGMPEIADYWRAIEKMNQMQKTRFVQRVIEHLSENLSSPTKCSSLISKSLSNQPKSVAVLGISFKPGTKDTRNTPAIEIVQHLLREGLSVHAFDRLLSATEALQVLAPTSQDHRNRLKTHSSVLEACTGVDAVLVLIRDDFCDYEEASVNKPGGIGSMCTSYKPSWKHIRRVMKCSPGIVFDGTTSLDVGKLTSLGFRVVSTGRAS